MNTIEAINEALDNLEARGIALEFAQQRALLYNFRALIKGKDKPQTLWKRIYELEDERQAISALFPDDATHKHPQTGESLYDNIQDALRDLARAKADLAAAREDVARMRKQIADHEEAEASVCPEDVGFVEFIGLLQRRIAGLVEAAAALRRFEKAPFITFEQICDIANNWKPRTREVDSAETTLRLIIEQHRAGLCSAEEAIGRAYRVGRERGGK